MRISDALSRGWRGAAVAASLLLAAGEVSAGECDFSCGGDTEESRPVTGYYNIEIGRRTDQATYLSPVKYHGTRLGLSGFWSKALPFSPQHAVMDFEGKAQGSRLLNPAGTASMIDVEASFRFGMSWRTRLPYNFCVSAGGYYAIEGGAMWLIRNSNNPVNLTIFTGVGAQGSVSYHFRIGRLPVLLTDRVRIPLTGAFFSPAYGETFWEIYVGNHSGLVHFGWPGNRFGIYNMLSATLDFGKTAMQIGYRADFQNQQACHLVTRTMTHTFVIGVVPGGLGLKRRKANANNSLY